MSLNVGIIGLGVGEKHILGYSNHPNCDVVAVCDFDTDKLNKVNSCYPDIQIYENSLDIIENDNIDILSIASYDSYHYDQILGGINNGKHIFVEKPMCLYKNEAYEIRNLLNKNPNIKFSSNLNLRTTPLFKKLKRLVKGDDFGEVFYIECDYNSGRINKVIDGWRGDEEFHSVVYSSAIHSVDLMCWIINDLPFEVVAFGNKIATKNTKFKFNDFVITIMKYRNSIIGKVTANIGCVHPHFHGLIVYGTNSTFINSLDKGYLYEGRKNINKPKIMEENYPGNKKGDIILSFVDSIIKDTQPIVTTDDVFNTMSICFAIEESMNRSMSMPVEYI